MLYIVSTPIGNLEDITLRALRILKESDYVLAEDTRRSRRLFIHYGIKKRLISYNDFNKEKKTKKIINDLANKKNISLISDSGTPGISDPGFYLVRECINSGIMVSAVPGPAALITALVCSGLPTDRFSFYGFFPKKESKKKALLSLINSRNETAVFYESPHRLVKTLALLSKEMPHKKIVVAREMTKKFEEFIRGTAKDVYMSLEKSPKKIKGEITIVVS